ncbi:hypothetical protein F5984_17460 [Rudanella paleaurantiibacter]|uniref:Peptidase M4 n=1 Tax=Rudanella paleaurantiibacter TaxID=2614655 RepID=A0A7J5TW57_9BACT|nr:hypothetical protein [Rudanella paleaurantiibacter]KAB7728629.1 hypothetical protein F5984_17460 [Rudanella paleaurantiibacter]
MLEYSPQESRLQTERKSPPTTCPVPPYRKLRGYAFDPSLSLEIATATINEVVYKVRWEEEETDTGGTLSKGPVGEYLEVVDYDPASGVFYHPVDLSDPYMLAQDGLAPSEGNPQFHQQMVYAVAMTTIQNMERALGRWVFWNDYHETTDDSGKVQGRHAFVRRLRLYPHALREANAYYSPDKKAILFGYFPALNDNTTGQLPGGLVFTCLSHDIIAHEMTHAVLDGMHRRYVENTNPDALAFHEAFSDIVALFQHFTFPEVLYQQIADTRGDLSAQSYLSKLGQQFGLARGKRNSLRDAIGEINPETGQWQVKTPKPSEYETTTEAHARGNILLAALFESFLILYKSRSEDLLRIATNGTGILPQGDLHPDLVRRLAGEAAKTARHLLSMCIRALDYCPPVDLNFGDYLRALITADYDLVSDDTHNYRLAIIGAFRKRGIYPKGIKTLSPESLRWEVVTDEKLKEFEEGKIFRTLTKILKDKLFKVSDVKTREDSYNFFKGVKGLIHNKISKMTDTQKFDELTGLCLSNDPVWNDQKPVFEVHSVRQAQRVTPDGDTVSQAIVVLTQRRDVTADDGSTIRFRGGCTLIFDLTGLKLRYCIRKNFRDERRLTEQLAYVTGQRNAPSNRAMYFGLANREPFAFLHR